MLDGLDRVIPLALEDPRNPSAELVGGREPIANAVSLPRPQLRLSILEAEDIHHFVELTLTKIIGDLALKLHTGRSRNEQIATDMRLFVRDAIDETLLGSLHGAGACRTGRAAGDAVMPSYTHLQRAEPVLVAHWLLAYVSHARARFHPSRRLPRAAQPLPARLGRHRRRDADARPHASPPRLSASTGRRPTAWTPPATATSAIEFTQALATLGLHISRFAEELTLHSTAEFGFLDLPERFSTGSSAMPQKKNPDFTELIRGKSGRLQGACDHAGN